LNALGECCSLENDHEHPQEHRCQCKTSWWVVVPPTITVYLPLKDFQPRLPALKTEIRVSKFPQALLYVYIHIYSLFQTSCPISFVFLRWILNHSWCASKAMLFLCMVCWLLRKYITSERIFFFVPESSKRIIMDKWPLQEAM
jgi:hypothetical protein